MLAVEVEVGHHHFPARLLDGGATPTEVEENPGELKAGRGLGSRHRHRPDIGPGLLDHARGAGRRHRGQGGKP